MERIAEPVTDPPHSIDVGQSARFEGSPLDMSDYYKSDEFRMKSMKVVPCSKRYVHDWTECPFAHPQEKARRRDPQTHNYTGIACPSMKREGTCAFGDWCPYAHNVFEYWLHPTRYRTQLCNDGSNCHRKICFFAHSLDELRVPEVKPFVSPEALAAAAAAASSDSQSRRRQGSVGPPSADLNLTPSEMARMSIESARQSQDWGPVPMPRNEASLRVAQHHRENDDGDDVRRSFSGLSRSSEQVSQEAEAGVQSARDAEPGQAYPPGSLMASPPETMLSQSPVPPVPHAMAQSPNPMAAAKPSLSPQEQGIIETITHMLARDTLNPQQAAALLHEMLPASSLSNLQSYLTLASADRKGADALLANLPGGADASMQRQSIESSRSSFDTARMSFENCNNRQSSEFSTPRASLESSTSYAPPAPAYPQYWTAGTMNYGPGPMPPRPGPVSSSLMSGPLKTVPEGMPMINAPRRSNPWLSIVSAGRSSAPVPRMSGTEERSSEMLGNMNPMSFDDSFLVGFERRAPIPGPDKAFNSSFFSTEEMAEKEQQQQ